MFKLTSVLKRKLNSTKYNSLSAITFKQANRYLV